MTPVSALEQAISDWADMGISTSDISGVANHVISSLRANGYVIKRAVPPCRGYELEDTNDAA